MENYLKQQPGEKNKNNVIDVGTTIDHYPRNGQMGDTDPGFDM